MFRALNLISKRCKRPAFLCQRGKTESLRMGFGLFQKRNNTDLAFEAEKNIAQSILEKLANQPQNSPGRIVFDLLVESGRIKIVDSDQNPAQDSTNGTGQGDADADAQDGDDRSNKVAVTKANLPPQAVEKLSETELALRIRSQFPNAASDWKKQQGSQLAVLDENKYVCRPNLQVPSSAHPMISQIPLRAKRLHDPIFDKLNCEMPYDWNQALTELLGSGQLGGSPGDDYVLRFLGCLSYSLTEGKREVVVDNLASKLLMLTGMDDNFLISQPKFPVTVSLSSGIADASSLTSIYDWAVTSQSLAMKITNQSLTVAPFQRLLSFVVEDKIGKRAPGVDGQLVAEMVVQAVYNQTATASFDSFSSFREKTQLVLPVEIRESDVYYATAIRFTGYKVSVYRAEMPPEFLDAIIHGLKHQPKAQKFVIREVASPSGGPFNLLKIQDLRALVDMLTSFAINCQLQLGGMERPSLFTRPWLDKKK